MVEKSYGDAIIVAQDCDLGAEYNHGRVSRLRLRNRACNALREIARIPCGQFQGATTLVRILYRLRGLECLLAVGEGALERTEAGSGHKVGMCAETARRGKLTSCAASALSSRTNATLMVGPLKGRHISRHGAIATMRSCHEPPKLAGGDCGLNLSRALRSFVWPESSSRDNSQKGSALPIFLHQPGEGRRHEFLQHCPHPRALLRRKLAPELKRAPNALDDDER